MNLPSGSRARGSAALLAAAALYLAAEWVGAAKIGGGRIFPRTRQADQARFRQMTEALSGASGRVCGQGATRLLFFNGDVTAPYLPLDHGRIGGCEGVHETGVSPFSDSDLARCDSAVVETSAPPLPLGHELTGGIDPGMAAAGWRPLERWLSDDARFGYVIYRRPCGAQP